MSYLAAAAVAIVVLVLALVYAALVRAGQISERERREEVEARLSRYVEREELGE